MNDETHTIPRIFHGPENICGIDRDIADWQRVKKDARSDFVVFKDNTNRQNSHQNLHFDKKNLSERFTSRLQILSNALKNYDIFHFYFGKSFLPLNLDFPILRIFGKIIIMDYVGSDIKLTRIEINRNPFFYLRKLNNPKVDGSDFLKRIRMIWQGIWMHLCLAQRNLYEHALTSIPKRKINSKLWVDNTFNIPDKLPSLPENKRVTVIHAPTNRLRKGTIYVQKAIDELIAEGIEFDFQIYQKVPHDEFIEIIKTKADIVVDQLINGGFGVLAMEAMAYGLPVCGYVVQDLRDLIPDLPLVQCTIDSLKDNLKDLILNKKKREEIGRAGWEFAKKHYDRDTIYEELWQIYLDLWNR